MSSSRDHSLNITHAHKHAQTPLQGVGDELQQVRGQRRKDKELISELEIKHARIETMKREFRLLFYSLDGAQVFFKDRDKDDE